MLFILNYKRFLFPLLASREKSYQEQVEVLKEERKKEILGEFFMFLSGFD
jgi:hypothetical protein